nr:hypothetical protein [Tanacetum cinerariifolium]
MTKDLSIPRRNKVNWHYIRDDIIFSTIKVVSSHQNTKQYGAILPIELTNEEIRNTKAYKEYYAYATREAAPKPKASARRKRSGFDSSTTPPTAVASPRPTIVATPKLTTAAKGKQPAKATKAKSLSALLEVAMTEAEQLKLALKRSRQQTHIFQPGGSGTDEGTGSKPGVPDVPSNDSDKEISWNSLDDEDTDAQEQDRHDDEGDKKVESKDGEEDDDDDKDGDESNDDDDDKEEIAKIDEHDDTKRGGDDKESESDEESYDEETKEEESFDPIPRTPEDSEDDGNNEEDQGFKDGEEEWLNEEEEADELYRDQESSSVSSQFMTSMLNSTSDAGVESIFATALSSVAPLPTPTHTMTPSIITTITTTSHAPIPPTPIPSDVIQNLPTFDLVFCFGERLKSLEASFSEYRQTNPFAEAVSKISADLSEMELKKILIEKMEGNKHDDDDDQGKGPSAGSDRRSKRQREGKEPESASAPKNLQPRAHEAFYGFTVNQESALDVYSKRRIIAITDLKIVEWHNYKHLDWISVRHDDDKIYEFKEGDFKRLRLQDIEDILLLLIQGKLSNLTVKEHFAFNVSLRMFTRSIVIQRRVEDLQLGVESYQKRLNLTKPDTYRSDLKRREAYTAYSNLRGFIYQNKDKKNRLMRIDELYKFSDEMLNDVRNDLDDRLKGIKMQYLP